LENLWVSEGKDAQKGSQGRRSSLVKHCQDWIEVALDRTARWTAAVVAPIGIKSMPNALKCVFFQKHQNISNEPLIYIKFKVEIFGILYNILLIFTIQKLEKYPNDQML
jgi:hypothetical protein